MPPERPVDPRRRTPDIAVARRCRLCLRAFGQAAPVTVPRFGRTGDRAPYRRWLCRVPLVAPSRPGLADQRIWRSEEHTSELQSLMRISYAVFCLKKKKKNIHKTIIQIKYMTLC